VFVLCSQARAAAPATAPAAAPARRLCQSTLKCTVVKQYPGEQQVQRAVKVMIPGTHFTTLTSAEQAVEYQGTAMEYDKNHKFGRHKKAWGDPHTGEGIRFVCESDAFDDPNHRGLWTTLTLWNRWRHDTYERDREAEVQFLDELPAVKAGSAPPPASEQHENGALNFEPEVKKTFLGRPGWDARGARAGQKQGQAETLHLVCLQAAGL